MKTVVIVAPSFAPSSYPPAIRTRFFVSHLHEFGWSPIVLTVRPEFLEEPQDAGFSALLPADIEVIRTRAVPQRFTRSLGFGDLGLRSVPFHCRELSALCRNGVDAVLIPGPPWYSFCLGPLICRRFKVPYVLDYIDPWVNSMGAEARWISKAWAAHRAALVLERPAAIHASGIVAVSDGTNETVRNRYPEIPPERFSVIPYGFEPGDLEILKQRGEISSHLRPFSGYLNVCYVGAMLPKAYSVLRAFFRAIRMMRNSTGDGDRLRIHFFGTTYAVGKAAKPLVLPVAFEEGVGELVSEHPERIPYLDALQVLLSADLLLALGSSEPHYTASKIFPYLLSRRPLLAVFHEASSVCSFMRNAGAGRLITYNDLYPPDTKINAVAEALREFLEGNTFGSDSPRLERLERSFSAREMARALVNVLESVASG